MKPGRGMPDPSRELQSPAGDAFGPRDGPSNLRDRVVPGASLLVLAGGESKRMGGVAKHLLPFGGSTVLQQLLLRLEALFDQTMISVREPGVFPGGIQQVSDVLPVKCPLAGLLSGLLKARNPLVFVTACDMPLIEPSLVRMLCAMAHGGADIVVPVANGFMEPLCAVYRRSVAAVIERYIDGGGMKVTGFYRSVRVMEVPERLVRICDPRLSSFINLNTTREYRRLSRRTAL